MGVTLSHWSALSLLRTQAGPCAEVAVTAVEATRFPQAAVVDMLRGRYADPSGKLHVLVSGAQRRQRRPGVVCHSYDGDLPPGSLLPVCKDVFSASPGLCFAQMASVLSFPRLVKLGFELCSGYALNPLDETGFISRPALASVAQLRAYLAGASHMRGAQTALKALGYVLDGSASPAESCLAMLLSLPTTRGGYGIEAPLLNARIDLDGVAARECRRSHCRCDLYWPAACLGVEYNSDRFHVGADRIERDAVRLNALGSMGVQVVTVTRPQLLDAGHFDDTAHIIAGHLGKRLRIRMRDFEERRARLRSEIFDFKSVA